MDVTEDELQGLRLFVDKLPKGCRHCGLCFDNYCYAKMAQHKQGWVNRFSEELDENCPLELVVNLGVI